MTRIMKQLAGILFVAVALIEVSCASQSTQRESEMTAEDAARELLDAAGVANQLIPMAKQQIRLEAMAYQAVAEADGREIDEIRIEVIDQWLDENIHWSDFEPGYIEIYTELFTRDEMLEIAAFQRSPAGKKAMELSPTIWARTGEIGIQIAVEKMPELDRLLERVDNTEEGHSGTIP